MGCHKSTDQCQNYCFSEKSRSRKMDKGQTGTFMSGQKSRSTAYGSILLVPAHVYPRLFIGGYLSQGAQRPGDDHVEHLVQTTALAERFGGANVLRQGPAQCMPA